MLRSMLLAAVVAALGAGSATADEQNPIQLLGTQAQATTTHAVDQAGANIMPVRWGYYGGYGRGYYGGGYYRPYGSYYRGYYGNNYYNNYYRPYGSYYRGYYGSPYYYRGYYRPYYYR